ncbi:hypothetical protein LTR85_004057 [Meristemomyces frigidus]|nr:hypothetical protein LTR85_004057 [Meristemomyces frigidus]
MQALRHSRRYRTEQPGGVEFKDQTSITAQRAREHYKSKGDPGALIRKSSNSPVNDSKCISSSLPLAGAMPWLGEELISPSVIRSQLYGQFMDIYLPKTRLDHFSFFQRIATMPTDESALLESLDALSLVTVGSLHKDKTLLNLSARTYGKALGSLAKAFSKPAQAVHSDDLLAATTVLASCALYDEIGQHADGWNKHVRGCQQLIAARGPESIKSELSLLLVSNTRHGALCGALIDRKAPLMARPDWRAVALNSPVQDSSTLFYDTAIQIPGVLERLDQLIQDPNLPTPHGETTASDVDDLIQECERLESELRDWFADWQLRALLDQTFTPLEGGILYTERPIDDFPTFTSLCSDRTFDTAFTFPSFPVAYLASLYWMCLYFLRTSMQGLRKLRHEIDENWCPEADSAVVEDELLMYVINLCRCLPFFCEPVSANTGQVGIFLPMRTAAIYFTSHGHWEYAKWIGAVRDSVFVKGLSPPYVGEPPGRSTR